MLLNTILLATLVTVINALYEQCGNVNQTQLFNSHLLVEDMEYPWMGIVREEDKSQIICLSMLITRRHVIMPAHCVTDKIDTITFDQPGRGRNEIAYQLAEVAIHPNYQFIKENDIAVGKLDRVVTDIQPICMPPPQDEPKYWGQRLETVGSTFEEGYLRIKGRSHVATPEYCLVQFKNLHTLPPSQICAFTSENFRSGSAIMGIYVPEGKPTSLKFYLVGILAFGIRNSNPNVSPRIFIKISHNRDWIIQNTFDE